MNELLISRLKCARLAKGLKQQEVAEQLGIKANTISNWEKGRTEPDIDSFVKLCGIYQIDCSALLAEVYEFDRIGNDVSLSEYEHLKKYRSIDSHGQELVDTILDKEYSRCTSDKALNTSDNIVAMPQADDDQRVQAAHTRTDIEVTPEMIQHDDDLMNDDSLWNKK